MDTITNSNIGDYDELIDTFNMEVLVTAHGGDYQGDSLYLLRDGKRVGFLCFGWGSCSGCDALQDSWGSIESLTILRDDLFASIQWFDSLLKAKAWVSKRDWEGTWLNKELVSEFKQSVQKV